MPLIGTAGHVDHGKSSLVTALTGRDPDRWEMEKQRGLTIDLGFAWADLGDGTEISFIDVPGHERYLKNMLAGVDALDVAVLVVAANEGWMPQTEEHLAVLDLLGTERGVVALTKADLVDATALENVAAMIASKTASTFLDGAAIIPTSVETASGLGELRSELLRLCGSIPDRAASRPRMWIDRVFTVSGIGTVVTGSLLGGRLAVSDEIEIYPSGLRARIRSLQTHESDLQTAEPGRRTAVALAGVDADSISRGDMFGHAGDWRQTGRFVAQISLARYVDELPTRAAYQAHIGTATTNARLLRAEDDRALIAIDDGLPLAAGDRLILRETGRRLVVAGGQILDPRPGKGSMTADLQPGLPNEVASRLLDLRGIDSASGLSADSGGGEATGSIVIGDAVVTMRYLEELAEICVGEVSKYHDTHPQRPGLPLATLATRLRRPRAVVEEAVIRSPGLEMRGADVALGRHGPDLDAEQARNWEITKGILDASLSVPSVSDLPLSIEAVHLLARRGELVRVSENLVMLPTQIETVLKGVRALEPPFGVGEFKEELGLSRKYAVPLLEWLDGNDYTIRRSEGRIPGPAL